jgi:hypothetical protein
MFAEWVEFEEFPGTRVLLEPMDYIIKMRVSNEIAKKQAENPQMIMDGEIVRNVIEYVVKNWEHAPLQRGKFSETFDRTHIRWLDFGFATQVYLKAAAMSENSEEETKNS